MREGREPTSQGVVSRTFENLDATFRLANLKGVGVVVVLRDGGALHQLLGVGGPVGLGGLGGETVHRVADHDQVAGRITPQKPVSAQQQRALKTTRS